MIDNFEQIKGLLKFDNENEFYFLQILQRKKDHPKGVIAGSNNTNRLIKAYYIYSVEQLENQREEIVQLATHFGARVYINLNRRNSKDVALELLADLAHNIKSGHLNYLHRSYSTICGRHHSGKDKTWVVDIDYDKPFDSRALATTVFNIEPVGQKILAVIPTRNGVHWITKPFNSQKFKEAYPDIDVHKNNPTILYIPLSSVKMRFLCLDRINLDGTERGPQNKH